MLEEIVDSVRGLEGDMAEIGVWRGRTADVIHRSYPSKILHLYDTFSGIVNADNTIDVHTNGEFSNTSMEKVRAAVGPDENIKFHVGIFPDTFTEFERKFCFVHSDTDTYFGAKATFDLFAPRMVPGGRMVFHDYDWHGCPGIKKAVQEFLRGKTLVTSCKDYYFAITF